MIRRLSFLVLGLALARAAAAEAPESGIDPSLRETVEAATFIEEPAYPNLTRIQRFLGLERQIRFDFVEPQRETAVAGLKASLDADDLDALLLFSRNLREEPDDPWARQEFYNFLSMHYDPMHKCQCQDLKKYVEYVNLWWDIDWDRAALEAAVYTGENNF